MNDFEGFLIIFAFLNLFYSMFLTYRLNTIEDKLDDLEY